MGLGPDQIRAVVEPIVTKEKVFRLADRTKARYRILLAQAPTEGTADMGTMVLPDIVDTFSVYLTQSNGASASEDLRELLRAKITMANTSPSRLEGDVTLEADNGTLAFSDRVRTFAWLVEKLRTTNLKTVQNTLGLIQFLTPDREALAEVTEGDLQVKSLIMANVSSNSAQIDAARSSKMYCGGRLTTFRHTYEAFVNLRLFLSTVVDDIDSCLLIIKMKEYVELLIDRQGRIFFDTCRSQPHLAIHPWQDLQHILSAFLSVATSANLYQAVMIGRDIRLSNFDSAVAVADGAISELRAILHGNGMGKFTGTPCCAAWFGKLPTAAPTKAKEAHSLENDPKKQRLDPSDIERRKTLGILLYDASVAGTNRLPSFPAYHKARGSKTPERVCPRFMTQGFACTSKDCRLPHISNLDALAPNERDKLVKFIDKQPGLSWAPGKAPAGTT